MDISDRHGNAFAWSVRDWLAAAWQTELAEVPEFAERTLHIIAGLLLPIRKRLPEESTRGDGP
jgi:hypothetical protein